MATAKRTMTLNLSEAEMNALEELCLKKDVSKIAIMRQALRLYQTIENRLERGEKLYFEDDKTNKKAEVMVL